MVDAIINEVMKGRLCQALVFMLADNSTVEAAFTKGNTSIKALFELIEKIKRAMIKHLFQFYIIHISGSRIIKQGTDRVSRGRLPNKTLSKALQMFAPLHLSAVD